MPRERRRIRVTGTVQGVGYRPFVHRAATALGLTGHVANDPAGVVVEAQGPGEALDALCRRLRGEAPPLARVAAVAWSPLPPAAGEDAFRVVASEGGGRAGVAVSVDVAPCPACLAELADPSDRRHGYPFTNCTDCGPRYTIVRRVPYDRVNTTMAGFEMCAACRREHGDPGDRRFHAQPNACPACGPRLGLLDPRGVPLASGAAALAAAAQRLRAGRIVAVKGVGGYHIAVDATDEAAVGELRRRKRRDDKPFAVLAADLARAGDLCRLDHGAAATLASPRAPIVVAARRSGARLAAGVAPGCADVGVMLPPSPLHHLLAGAAGRPLVLTSGNLTDEPIAYQDGDALARLGPLVDAVLAHDRPIHVRCDDSVVRAGRWTGVQVLRRSRGYAPEPLALAVPARRAVLAVGAELKSTVAVAEGGRVVAGHHLGDLEHWAAYRSFLQAVDHLCRLSGVEPEVVAHDLHPEYLSAKFATGLDLPAVPVQHHHAHVASCLVDHGRTGPVVGLAFDGLGWGGDGTLWGGEALVADLRGYERAGHLRPVPLPGGAAAIREPWRMALAWLDAACGREAAAGEGARVDARAPGVLAVLDGGPAPPTTSVGRLFDAVAALLGIRRAVTYEGQAAVDLEAAARRVRGRPPPLAPVEVGRRDGTAVMDPGPLLAALVRARDAGTPPGDLAAAFHHGLAAGAAALAGDIAAARGLGAVALTGGVFQNALLTGLLRARLEAAGLEVLLHRQVPPNDGGISIGQAAVAAARDPGAARGEGGRAGAP